MIYYSEKTILELFQNDTFLDDYHLYQQGNEQIQSLINSLNSIELNKKYFRLTMNQSLGHKKKFKNKNVGEDTIAIKEVNSLLNKLTDKNYEEITKKIKLQLENKNYLSQLIIDTIIKKCIIHTLYIPIYITLMLKLYSSTTNLNEMIILSLDTFYQDLNETNINKEQSVYLQFCDANRKLDQFIGYSLVLTECEKKRIVSNKIHPTINGLLDILKHTEDSNEKYKCVQCLYNILKSLYQGSLLPEGYIQKINEIKDKETSMKIKFKYMDILERK